MFIYPIYNHNWRNISTIYVYKKTSIQRNILTIKQNISGSSQAKVLTGGGDLSEAQVDVPLSVSHTCV